MNTLSTWIFTVLLSVAPPQKAATHSKEPEAEMRVRYESIARDMSEAIKESKPLFSGSNNEQKTAALLSSIAFYESGFRKEVDNGNLRGDHGRSWCLMQINIGKGHVNFGDEEMKSWTGKDLVEDRKKCFKVALEVLRRSMNMCRGLAGGGILSGYTTGRCIPNQHEAVVRWDLSRRIMREHPALIEDSKLKEYVKSDE